jgi:hypothetical protein
LLAVLLIAMGCAHAEELPEAGGIGYPTVAAALEDLKSKPEAAVRDNNGWTIIAFDTPPERFIWSFTPTGHPAHPAAIKRTIYQEAGSVMMRTEALCQARKLACDELMHQFAEMQREVQERFGAGGGGP